MVAEAPRSTGFLLLLTALPALAWLVAVEVRAYAARHSAANVAEERRRLARDLHDGVTQELAFIATEARRLAARSNADPVLTEIACAAEQARMETRTAIRRLAVVHDFSKEVVEQATTIASRGGAQLDATVVIGVSLAADEEEALVRIVREAVTNAVRHGRAPRVRLDLDAGAVLWLRVRDNGCGFDPGAVTAGFGLRSMRERAHALGGSFAIRSGSGGGTEVVVAR